MGGAVALNTGTTGSVATGVASEAKTVNVDSLTLMAITDDVGPQIGILTGSGSINNTSISQTSGTTLVGVGNLNMLTSGSQLSALTAGTWMTANRTYTTRDSDMTISGSGTGLTVTYWSYSLDSDNAYKAIKQVLTTDGTNIYVKALEAKFAWSLPSNWDTEGYSGTVSTTGGGGYGAKNVTITGLTPPLTDDTTPTLTGTLSAPLLSGEVVGIYDNTNTLQGTATVNGLTWSYTPSTALANGSYAYQARVLDSSGAKVLSSAHAMFTVATPTPITTTATITAVSDNLSVNGSIGSTTTPYTIDTKYSTDDTTPTISGTLSAALTGTQVLAVYDGTTRLGTATVAAGATSYTYTPGSAWSYGAHSIRVQVEDPAGGTAALNTGTTGTVATGVASTAKTVNVDSLTLTAITDNVGPQIGTITNSSSTDDTTPTLTGTLSAPLLSGEVVGIYDNTNTLQGTATVNGLTWSYTPSTALANGSYAYQARVLDSSGAMVLSSAYAVFVVDTTAISTTAAITTMGDNVGLRTSDVSTNQTTDDTTPTLSGTVSAALLAGQVVAVYDNGVKVGTATTTGTSWTFTPSAAVSSGMHSYKVQVENSAAVGATLNTTGVATVTTGVASASSYDVNVTTITLSVSDDVGTVIGVMSSGTVTDDNKPTFSVKLSAPLLAGEKVAIYIGDTYVADAIADASGTSYSYTPSAAMAAGTYAFNARVIDASGTVLLGTAAAGAGTQITIASSAPITTTAAITAVGDNYGLNTTNVSNSQSTDDWTLSLTGTLSAVLNAGEVVSIYNGSTYLGKATVTGTTWSFATPSLATGAVNLTAQVENPILGASSFNSSGTATAVTGVPSAVFATNLTGIILDAITDDVGTVVGAVAAGSFTDDVRPTVTGSLLMPLLPNEVVAIYNGDVRLGTATTTGTTYSWTPTADMAPGTYNINARVENPSGVVLMGTHATGAGQAVTIAAPAVISTTTQIISVTDNVGLKTGVLLADQSTDDTTLKIAGTISAVLTGAQKVAVYDGTTMLGYAVALGSTWSYTTAALSTGVHSLRAQVEDASAVTALNTSAATAAAGTASAAFATNVEAITLTSVVDDVGSVMGVVAAGGTSDDTMPTISGTLAVIVASGEKVAIYNGDTFLGWATVSGTTWTYTPTTALAAGTYQINARVTDASGNVLLGTAAAGAGQTLVIVPNTAPTATAAIVQVLDDVSINGSVGSSSAPANVPTQSTTDDTTPLLKGTVSAVLNAGEVVVIYDGATQLGTATVTGTTWTFDTSTSPLLAGQHSFTAQVQNAATGATTAASSAWVVNVDAIRITGVLDDFGPSTGSSLPTVTLALPSYVGTSATIVGYGDVSNITSASQIAATAGLGSGAPAGLSYTVQTGTFQNLGGKVTCWCVVQDGIYVKAVQLQLSNDASGNVVAQVLSAKYQITNDLTFDFNTGGFPMAVSTGSSVVGYGISALTLTGAGVSASVAMDDQTPTLSGSLNAPLMGSEVVQVLDGTTVLGTATTSGTGSSTTWSFTPSSNLDLGMHTFKVQVINSAGHVLAVSSPAVVEIVSSDAPTTTATVVSAWDDVSLNGSAGNASSPAIISQSSSMDDTMPTIKGGVSAALTSSEKVGVYDNGTFLGYAKVTGSVWEYTGAVALSAGGHAITARVENTVNGQASEFSSAYSLNVNSVSLTSLVDDVGTITGALAHGDLQLNAVPSTTFQSLGKGSVRNITSASQIEMYTYPVYQNGDVYYMPVASTFKRLANGGVECVFIHNDGIIYSDGSYFGRAIKVQLIDSGTGEILGAIVQAGHGTNMQNNMPVLSSSALGYGALNMVVHGAASTVTDDTLPLFQGKLEVSLLPNEVLQVFDGNTKLGNATIDSTGHNWSFQVQNALTTGYHSISAKVIAADGSTVLSTPTEWVTVGASGTPTQTVSIVQCLTGPNLTSTTQTPEGPNLSSTTNTLDGATSGDRTPILKGTLSSVLQTGQVVEVYVDGKYEGVATASGTTWTYSPQAPLSYQMHQFTAKVKNLTDNTTSADSNVWHLYTNGFDKTTHASPLPQAAFVDDQGAYTGRFDRIPTDDSMLSLQNINLRAPLQANEHIYVYGAHFRADTLWDMLVYLGEAVVDSTGVVASFSNIDVSKLATTGYDLIYINMVDGSGAVLDSFARGFTYRTDEFTTAWPWERYNSQTYTFTVGQGTGLAQTLDLTKVGGTAQPRVDTVILNDQGTLRLDTTDVALSGTDWLSSTKYFGDLLSGSSGHHQMLIEAGFSSKLPNNGTEYLETTEYVATTELVGTGWTAMGNVVHAYTNNVYNIYTNGIDDVFVNSKIAVILG